MILSSSPLLNKRWMLVKCSTSVEIISFISEDINVNIRIGGQYM